MKSDYRNHLTDTAKSDAARKGRGADAFSPKPSRKWKAIQDRLDVIVARNDRRGFAAVAYVERIAPSLTLVVDDMGKRVHCE